MRVCTSPPHIVPHHTHTNYHQQSAYSSSSCQDLGTVEKKFYFASGYLTEVSAEARTKTPMYYTEREDGFHGIDSTGVVDSGGMEEQVCLVDPLIYTEVWR